MNIDSAQRIRWTILGALAGLAILLTILDNTGALDNVFAFIRDPASILLSAADTGAETVSGTLSGPRDLATAQVQISELEARVAELERQNEALLEIQGEYQTLLDLVNRARQTPELRRVTARVIGYDPSPAVRSIIIDKGSNDGIVVGMPVESARGLVGRVFRTTPNASQVALLVDNASAIPVRMGTSRATGILQGGGLGGETVINWIDWQYDIERGEVVLTSGLGGNFPEDVPIGRVIEVQSSEAELFQSAIVQPAVDFSSLEIVFVITNFQQIDTDVFSSPLEN